MPDKDIQEDPVNPYKSLQPHELNDIIEACKRNNGVAQEKLYRHYFAWMYSICKQYAYDRQAILSLINEGFLKIFIHLKTFDSEKGNFEGWIKKIMANTCIDHARSKKNKNESELIDEECVGENQLHLMPNNFMEEEVMFLIKKLPPVTREVFSLHVFNGYSHKEIAQKMNMAEGTSRWHVLEARKNLKPQLHKIL